VTTQPPKKKGGKRQGAGRKKSEARIVAEVAAVASPDLDGRSPGGKAHAAWLIEQLNAIDPEMMRTLDYGVSSEPIKVPKDADDELRAHLEREELRRRELLAAKRIALKRWNKLSFEIRSWARHWFSHSEALETKKYLHDKAGHQAVRVINHVHDKPIDVNLNVSMAQLVREVRERKEKYERSRR
jgi:hypothetical protein